MCDRSGDRNEGTIEDHHGLIENEVFYSENTDPPPKPPRTFAYAENHFKMLDTPPKPPRHIQKTTFENIELVNNFFF